MLSDRRDEMVAFKKANGEMFFATAGGTNVFAQKLAETGAKLTEARLNAARMSAQRETAANLAVAGRNWQEAEQEAAAYETLYEAEKRQALDVNAKQAGFERMQEEADRTMRACDALDQRIKELAVAEQSGGMNIQVLEAARPEARPSSPNKKATLLAGGVMGLLLGCGLAGAREWADGRLRTADEAGRALGLAVLGVIPLVADRPGRGRLPRTAQGVPSFGPQRRLCGEPGDDPYGEAAEAYRMLRTVVYFNCSSQTGRSILVTSPERFDGKSTTCANLAAAMARSGRRTLLVDADLRKPVQHEIFAVPGGLGLGDVLARGARLEQATQRTAVEGLSVLPAGAPLPNPAEAVNGEAFVALLRRLETIYDFVLIDSPPLLAVSDGHILGAQVEQTILVVRSGRSTRREARLALERLARVGSRVMGVVLNAAPRSRGGAGAGYYGYAAEPPVRRLRPAAGE